MNELRPKPAQENQTIMEVTDKTSIARLQQLHPSIRQSAIDAYTEACKVTPVGVHPFITETLRSFERSTALYNQGRTTPGEIVTNAKGGSSLHNYGLALDFVIHVNGKEVWKVDVNWMKVVAVFKKHGFAWGGDFKSIPDAPHFQKTNGLGWRDLLAKYNAKDFIPGDTYVNV